MKTMSALPLMILNWSQVENLTDINPGFSDASVNMYDFDSSFDEATSAMQNVGKQTLKKEEEKKNGDQPSTLTLKSELDKFCCLTLEPREVYLLKWWKTNRSIFFRTWKKANKMLCSPPSSGQSERLFIIGGNIYTPQPNNAGDWREIDTSELQSADLQFKLQKTEQKVTQRCIDLETGNANCKCLKVKRNKKG